MTPNARRKILTDIQVKLSLLGCVPNRKTLRMLRSIHEDLSTLMADADREALDWRNIPMPTAPVIAPTPVADVPAFDDGDHIEPEDQTRPIVNLAGADILAGAEIPRSRRRRFTP